MDDTAKTLICLNELGFKTDASAMVKTFRANDHFKTYPLERNASLSANCHVLSALASSADVTKYQEEVEIALRYVCQTWQASGGHVEDKWVRQLSLVQTGSLEC